MTTTYTPTGQIVPVPEYVLPQDVTDLVVVETVNNPFTTAADNIAWLLLMLLDSCSVKNFGAVGDDTTDDTAAINAAIAARPFVYFPTGLYRHTGLTVVRSCVLFGVNGSSSLRLDHATNNYFSLPNGDTVLQLRDVSVRAKQNNIGTVFAAASVPNVKVTADRCTINPEHYLLGRIANTLLAGVQLNDCDTSSRYTGSGYSLPVAQGGVRGGKLEMAPAATDSVIGPIDSASRVHLSDVYFWQISTLGGISFVDCGIGQIVSDGCTFSVNDAGAGSGTFAFRINGAQVHVSNITLIVCNNYQFATKAAHGSRLELIPVEKLQSSASSFTLYNGVETIVADATNSAPVHVALPRILFDGQRHTVIVQNGSGGNWSGPFVLTAQAGDGILDAGSGEFNNLPQDRACAVSFVAADYFGDVIWIQSCASVQVPP
jgi:hypothetical protein